jgi:hypothetical protein
MLGSISQYTPDVARVETFVGFQYIRANPRANSSALVMRGAKGELILNFTNVLALVTEAGLSHDAHLDGFRGNPNTLDVLVGPRLTSRRFGRLTPYFQVNVGAVYKRGEQVPATAAPVAASTATNTRNIAKAAWATSAGIGFDIRIFHWLSIRPIALEYFMTRIDKLREPSDRQQSGLRYTGGITLRMGKR